MQIHELPKQLLENIASRLPTTSVSALALTNHGLSPAACSVLATRLPVPQPAAPFLWLPTELIIQVISYISTEELPSIALACRRFSSIIRPALTKRMRTFVRSSQHQTVLHLGAFNGDLRLIRLGLAAGASPNAETKFESTPLHHACIRHHPSTPTIVKTLIAAGSNVTKRNYHYRTPLHYAATHDDIETVHLLLAAGNSPWDFCPDVDTPLEIAAMYNQPALIKIFLTTPDTPSPEVFAIHDGISLSSAATNGHIAALTALLDDPLGRFQINALPAAKNPLNLAAQYGHIDMMKFLLSRGADPNHPGNDPPLRLAVVKAQIEAVAVLLRAGADPGLRGWPRTALEVLAAEMKKLSAPLELRAVKVLLEKGPDAEWEIGDLMERVRAEERERAQRREEEEALARLERLRIREMAAMKMAGFGQKTSVWGRKAVKR
ncbi:ankyrin repeat-containing domain protein [Geopyxis carbonaria]|nr:ankyrin repeat-containing domain protein [Geopyxis carbonaria]